LKDVKDARDLAETMKERAEYYIECSSPEGLARDYALAFLSEVDFYDIAKHMIAEYSRDSSRVITYQPCDRGLVDCQSRQSIYQDVPP
jgi:hypothetical protein